MNPRQDKLLILNVRFRLFHLCADHLDQFAMGPVDGLLPCDLRKLAHHFELVVRRLVVFVPQLGEL